MGLVLKLEKAANAVINQGLDTFNTNLDKLRNSAGTTEKAYATMTNTTEFATQRMENSFDNLAIAIGDDLNPTVSQFKMELPILRTNLQSLLQSIQQSAHC